MNKTLTGNHQAERGFSSGPPEPQGCLSIYRVPSSRGASPIVLSGPPAYPGSFLYAQ